MKRWLVFLLACGIFAFLHEGTHALVAQMYGEYQAFHVRPIGLEVVYNTPVEQRQGIQWAAISGASNLVTLLLGYGLLALRHRIAGGQSGLLRMTTYYLTLILLLGDAFNLSLGPFLYGGDVYGVAEGLNLHPWAIQAVFFGVLLLNRELVAQELLPAYGVHTQHPLLKPWIRVK